MVKNIIFYLSTFQSYIDEKKSWLQKNLLTKYTTITLQWGGKISNYGVICVVWSKICYGFVHVGCTASDLSSAHPFTIILITNGNWNLTSAGLNWTMRMSCILSIEITLEFEIFSLFTHRIHWPCNKQY